VDSTYGGKDPETDEGPHTLEVAATPLDERVWLALRRRREEITEGWNELEETHDTDFYRAFVGTTRDQRYAIRSALLKHYKLRLDDGITQGEARLQAVFSDLIEPRWLNCCSRGHIAYTGIYAMCEECPECEERQYNSHGKPNCCWPYIPLIPRLAIQYHSATRSRQLTTYRREFPTLDGTVKDVFDGKWFRECCDIGYFTDPRTLALRITLDGIGLTKNTRPEQKITPVVIYLLNLHPSIRDQHANALTSFVIPGSFKEEYIDTWLNPLMTELRTLCGGVSGVWDGATGESFVLRAHPILVTGDGQAVADIMVSNTRTVGGVRNSHSRVTCAVGRVD
jgi:hypothetical protein